MYTKHKNLTKNLTRNLFFKINFLILSIVSFTSIKLATCAESESGRITPLTAPVGRRLRPRTTSFCESTGANPGDRADDEASRIRTYCAEFDFGGPVPVVAAAGTGISEHVGGRSAAELWGQNQGLMEEIESLREDSIKLAERNLDLSRANAEFARERNRLLAELAAASARAVKPETRDVGVNTDPSCLSATIVIRPAAAAGAGAGVLDTSLRLPRAGVRAAVVERAGSPVPAGAAARARRASREELLS